MPILKNVEAIRQVKMMTLEQLSELSKVSMKSVWKATKGQPVSFATAKKIAAALGTTPQELV